MHISVIVSGDLANGYEAIRPIVLSAELVFEAHDVAWVITDEHFHRCGYNREFRLALADCLADMTHYLEAAQEHAKAGTPNQFIVEEMARYLRRVPNTNLDRDIKPSKPHKKKRNK